MAVLRVVAALLAVVAHPVAVVPLVEVALLEAAVVHPVVAAALVA